MTFLGLATVKRGAEDVFRKALKEASHYGLYDLHRLEEMILSQVAGEFFKIDDDV